MRKSRDISELGYSFICALCPESGSAWRVVRPWSLCCVWLFLLFLFGYILLYFKSVFCLFVWVLFVHLFWDRGSCPVVQPGLELCLYCSSSGILGMHHHARLTISHILIVSSMPDSEVKLKREYDRSDRKYYIIMCDYLNHEHNFQGKNDAVASRTEYTNSQWKKIILLKIQ